MLSCFGEYSGPRIDYHGYSALIPQLCAEITTPVTSSRLLTAKLSKSLKSFKVSDLSAQLPVADDTIAALIKNEELPMNRKAA